MTSRKGRVWPLLAAVALAACGPSREKEPNETPETATPLGWRGISAARRVEGTLAAASDVDVYRLDSRQDAVLSGRLTGIRDADFTVSVLDADKRELKRFDETGIGGDEEILDVGVRAGPVYVVVANKNTKANNPDQKYTLELSLQRGVGREREPNETPQTASKLEVPGVTRGHYYPSRNLLSGDTDYLEQDWYAIELEQPGMFLLNLEVTGVPKIDPILEIYDQNGYKIKEVDSAGIGEGESLRGFGARPPARYHLRLRGKQARAANGQAAYEILTELVPYQGKTEFEPNDQRSDATPMALERVEGTIAPEGDRDWYRVAIPGEQRQLLRATVTGPEELDLVLVVADAVGAPLLTIDNAGKGQPETLTGLGVQKGDVHLIVYEKSGRKADVRHPYALVRQFVPWQPGLEYELNDSTAQVQAIKLNESVDGYIAPKGDVDFYEFNVYARGPIAFEAAGVLNVRLMATLYDQDYRELRTWTADKPGDPLSFEKALDRGTYTLRLKAADPAHNNVRDKYSLRLRAR